MPTCLLPLQVQHFRLVVFQSELYFRGLNLLPEIFHHDIKIHHFFFSPLYSTFYVTFDVLFQQK